MFDEAYRVWQACIASASSAGVAWMKFASSGVQYDGKTNGICDDVVSASVRSSIQRNHENRRPNPMMERHGITRAPDSPNVLVVDFGHFRFVRDVRASLYGDRRSPLASDQRVKT